jgi:hypothetical protein
VWFTLPQCLVHGSVAVIARLLIDATRIGLVVAVSFAPAFDVADMLSPAFLTLPLLFPRSFFRWRQWGSANTQRGDLSFDRINRLARGFAESDQISVAPVRHFNEPFFKLR